MATPVHEVRAVEPTLNTVSAGLQMATETVSALQRGESVRLDLTAAQRMTPSFANALVMSILAAVGLDQFREHVFVATTSDLVQEAWDKAFDRYQRGIRLSTQHGPRT